MQISSPLLLLRLFAASLTREPKETDRFSPLSPVPLGITCRHPFFQPFYFFSSWRGRRSIAAAAAAAVRSSWGRRACMQESPLVGRAKRLLLFSIAAAPSWGIRTPGLLMRAFLFHSTYRIYINEFCILQQLPAHQYFNNRFAHSCKKKGSLEKPAARRRGDFSSGGHPTIAEEVG